MQLQLHIYTQYHLCNYLKMSQVPLDPLISFGEHLVMCVYAVTLATKMLHTKLAMRANQLMIVSIVCSMVGSVIWMVCDVYELNNSNATEVGILFSIAIGFNMTMIVSLVWLLDIRNRILIPGKTALTLSRCLVALVIVSAFVVTIPFWIYTGTPVNNGNYFAPTALLNASTNGATVQAISLCVYDVISTAYLLMYYERYFFASPVVMRFLRPQMAYRRNWVIFVLVMDILTVVLVILGTVGIYPESTTSFLLLSFLFQLNTMIDFVRFDTVRHEITIRDFTVSVSNGTNEEEIDSMIPKVC